jgi:hypothetical protein
MWLSLSVSPLCLKHLGGGTAKATAALSELTHAALMLWLITQLHECGNQFLSLESGITTFSRAFWNGKCNHNFALTFCQIRNVTESCGASPPERVSRCLIIRL